MPTARDLLSVVRRTQRVLAKPAPRLTLFGLVALAAAWPLLGTAVLLNEFRDAHVLSHYEQTAIDTVVRYHQFPLWDPFYCGGMYLLGTPQERFASPTFLLSLVFGEQRGEALAVFAMIVVGLEGAYQYARSRKASAFGALLGAPIFALSGLFAIAPSLGWINFFSFELIPWAAYGVRRAVRGDRIGVVIAAVALAWCVGFGGTYAAPMAALWCAFEALEWALRNARRPSRAAAALGMAAVTASLILGLSAFRLWPVLDSMRAAPRVIGGAPATDVTTILRMLFLPNTPGATEHTDDGTYLIGVLAAPAILFGALRWRSASIVLAATVAAWLGAGYAIHPSLFAVLRRLPIYSTLRYPERYLIFVALAGSVLAARGVTFAQAATRASSEGIRRFGRIALAIAAVGLVANIGPLVAGHHIFAGGRDMSAPPPNDGAGRPFHQARGTRWALAYYEPMNRGVLSCWEAYPVPQSPALAANLLNEERLADPWSGTLSERRWSPNAIDLDVHLTRPGRVEVNQNWHAGWRANVGKVVNERGLLAVDMPAGDHAVTLRFLPRSAVGGALVSLVSLFALGLLVYRKPDAAGLAMLACAPLVPFGLVFVFMREPGFRSEPTLPDGGPVVVDAPSPSARRLDVHIEGGVTLEAASPAMPSPKAGETLPLELDWRRATEAGSGLGVFMHIEREGGDTIVGDHVLLSTVLDLDEAPPDRTLRDVIPLAIPEDAKGKHWKVWVGLWRVRGGGERMHVLNRGKATVAGDRILAAQFEVQ